MKKTAIVTMMLAACAAEPMTSGTEQTLCQRNPVTGRCKTLLDPDDAQSIAQGQVAATVDTASNISASCSRGTGGYTCGVDFTWGDRQWTAQCTVWDDGTVDCDAFGCDAEGCD